MVLQLVCKLVHIGCEERYLDGDTRLRQGSLQQWQVQLGQPGSNLSLLVSRASIEQVVRHSCRHLAGNPLVLSEALQAFPTISCCLMLHTMLTVVQCSMVTVKTGTANVLGTHATASGTADA